MKNTLFKAWASTSKAEAKYAQAKERLSELRDSDAEPPVKDIVPDEHPLAASAAEHVPPAPADAPAVATVEPAAGELSCQLEEQLRVANEDIQRLKATEAAAFAEAAQASVRADEEHAGRLTALAQLGAAEAQLAVLQEQQRAVGTLHTDPPLAEQEARAESLSVEPKATAEAATLRQQLQTTLETLA